MQARSKGPSGVVVMGAHIGPIMASIWAQCGSDMVPYVLAHTWAIMYLCWALFVFLLIYFWPHHRRIFGPYLCPL